MLGDHRLIKVIISYTVVFFIYLFVWRVVIEDDFTPKTEIVSNHCAKTKRTFVCKKRRISVSTKPKDIPKERINSIFESGRGGM